MKKQTRVLKKQPYRSSYDRLVSAMLGSRNAVQQQAKEPADRQNETESPSDDEPPPPIELIVLESGTGSCNASKEYLADIKEEMQEQPDYLEHRQYQKDPCMETEQQAEQPTETREEMLLKLAYKGVPTSYYPDAELIGDFKAPKNLYDVLSMRIEWVLDL